MRKNNHNKAKFSNSDRVESVDPQFLTFRKNPQHNTGRTLFSQKIQMYQSLQKNKFFQSLQQQQIPIDSFKKTSNLRTLRSQQKLQTIPTTPLKKNIQNNSDEKKQQLINQLTEQQLEFKNQLLKKKIQKIIKNISSEQKKQTLLQKEIQETGEELEEDDRQIQSQNSEIQQLKAIHDQNQVYLEKLTKSFQDFQNKNHHLQSLVQKIEDSLQNITNTTLQEASKAKMAQKLKEGLKKLENLKNEVSSRYVRMQTQIQKLKEMIEQSENIDLSIKDTAFSRQNQNNSHFTC